LDPTYPEERLRFMVADAAAQFVITDSEPVRKFSDPANQSVNGPIGKPIELQELLRELEKDAPSPAPLKNDADDLAYVIYTSGSTGRPKGVQVTHRNVARLFAATDSWFHFGPEDVFTLFHSYAFDFAVWELWGALLYGGRLVIVTYAESRDPEAFYELLHRERVTVLNQTPSAFRQLVHVDEAAWRPL